MIYEERYGYPGWLDHEGNWYTYVDHDTSVMVNGVIVRLPPPSWKSLDRKDQLMLIRISEEPSLVKLIDPEVPESKRFTMGQYRFFRITGLIFDNDGQITLAPHVQTWIQRFEPKVDKREMGDQVEILIMRPRIGRLASTYGHWIAETDLGIFVNLYQEDFQAIGRMGYKLPDWHDTTYGYGEDEEAIGFEAKAKRRRGSPKREKPGYKCHINAILFKEIKNSGWRIAKVLPPDLVEETA